MARGFSSWFHKHRGKIDRTHDPKPTSGWWGDTPRHRDAALKNNSHGGLGAGARREVAAKAHHAAGTARTAPGGIRKHVIMPAMGARHHYR